MTIDLFINLLLLFTLALVGAAFWQAYVSHRDWIEFKKKHGLDF